MDNLITPVIHTVEDPDPRVRYYACESLYNIIRITGHECLEYFNYLFDCLCRLFPDIDMDVKNISFFKIQKLIFFNLYKDQEC